MAASSKIYAVKADLNSMGKNVLLVEGADDWHAFSHLIHATTGAYPAYELGYCGSDVDVLDQLSGVVEASRQTQTTLGAILDADSPDVASPGDGGVQARIRSLQGRLGKYYAVPATLPASGLILEPMAERDRDRLPKLGIWLMPDNLRDGIFEDLLCAAMTTKSQKYVANVVDQASKDGMTGFRDVELPKAIVKTHIAWQDPNKKDLGVAIPVHFENLRSACAAFLAWLDQLFNVEENDAGVQS